MSILLRYNYNMKIKPLIETNPYLKDPLLREKLIARSVRTSGGVEGIRAINAASQKHHPEKKTKNSLPSIEKFGALKGHSKIANDFDAPLPDDILAQWH